MASQALTIVTPAAVPPPIPYYTSGTAFPTEPNDGQLFRLTSAISGPPRFEVGVYRWTFASDSATARSWVLTDVPQANVTNRVRTHVVHVSNLQIEAVERSVPDRTPTAVTRALSTATADGAVTTSGTTYLSTVYMTSGRVYENVQDNGTFTTVRGYLQ